MLLELTIYLVSTICESSNVEFEKKLAEHQITIFTRSNDVCSVKAKAFLKSKNLEYVEANVDKNKTAKKYMCENFPKAKFPVILYCGEICGSLAELKQLVCEIEKKE